MIPIKWPWSWEEEAEWEEEIRREENGWMEDLLDHMIHDRMVSAAYDPLQSQEDADEESVIG